MRLIIMSLFTESVHLDIGVELLELHKKKEFKPLFVLTPNDGNVTNELLKKYIGNCYVVIFSLHWQDTEDISECHKQDVHLKGN